MADAEPAGKFDRDTAVQLRAREDAHATFAAEVSPDWRAGVGPHGGYISALVLRALMGTVADATRAPRSLTMHFPRAPEPGPAEVLVTVEREGRSLSTLSARLVQDGRLRALALAAFSRPWSGPEVAELPIPDVAPGERGAAGLRLLADAPPIAHRTRLQPRLGGVPLSGADQPMELGGWLAMAEPRPLDALAIAFYADALLPTPFMRMAEPNPVPTVDLTVHFRTSLPRVSDPDPEELTFVRVRSRLIHEGFFEEDTTMWAQDGTVLAQARQLALFVGS